MISALESAPARLPKDTLTRRQKQIIGLVEQGLNTVEIAQALRISKNSLRNHLARIYDKTGMSNLRELKCKFCPERKAES